MYFTNNNKAIEVEILQYTRYNPSILLVKYFFPMTKKELHCINSFGINSNYLSS